MTFWTRRVQHINVNVINFKNRFKIKYAYINELINKLFTFANFYQININNDDDDRDDYVIYVKFKHSALLI